MKKIFILSLFLVPLALWAQTGTPTPTPTPVPTGIGFNLPVLVQQLLTNGGLALLAFLLTKVPGPVGSFLKSVVDWFSANLKH